ncbi:LOW QUALITY PROTEIN: putative olfactory receptor 1F2 [Papio anubis]|uniref:LOW QUALITY PROTEIN: putative olfactory receptor 1F2 n=1 Tax=Papio anubis TaxID=9555 RepID=UPI0012ADE81B|nr:LOW QUALITY PROTEIN: putative olfactory receptor 1F2 [Papio anubis]
MGTRPDHKLGGEHILGTQTISFSGCLTQMYFISELADMDNFLLAVMAYDHFVAVCHPLYYTAKMTHQLCALLVTGSRVVNSLNALLHIRLMARLSFCADNTIPHVFRDVTPLLKLSYSDTHLNEVMILTEAALVTITPYNSLVMITPYRSYMHIACAILRVPSMKGRWKAFSTCGSHLAVVLLFYGTIISLYFSPSSSHSAQRDIAAAVMFTVVSPMLNPFIYSLRNKDIKWALGKVVGRKTCSYRWTSCGIICHFQA